jgi:hypothetical protein
MSIFNAYSELNFWNELQQIVRFEVLTAVVMKSSISWDIMPCHPFKNETEFRRKISFPSSISKNKPRNQHEAGSKQKLRLVFSGLYSFIHSFTHSFIHSIHSLTHSLTHSFIHSFIHSYFLLLPLEHRASVKRFVSFELP